MAKTATTTKKKAKPRVKASGKTSAAAAAPSAAPSAAAGAADVRARVEGMVRALEAERGGTTLYLFKLVKGMASAKDVMTADPHVQVEFVRHVVGIYAKLGAASGKWFRSDDVPNASAEIVRLLLRRKLPFTDDMLAEMFEQLARIKYLPMVEYNEQLAMALEKRAESGDPLPSRLRSAAVKFADILAVRHVPPAEAKKWREEWNFPTPTDRKAVARIDGLLDKAE